MNDVSFQPEIRQLQERRDAERADLEKLREQLKNFDEKTREIRAHLRRLRRLARGELPEDGPEGRNKESIERVETHPESGRPPRGARRRQIQSICETIGSDGRTFRTREVLDRLAEVEEELTEGMKSYAYSVMDDLAEEKLVEKVGWGQWQLKP